jgi:hypothetical protein
MDQPTIVPAVEDDAATFELGEMLGRRQAFGTMAGRCSAADAECLRRIRDGKMFLNRATTWDEFCPRYLGLSGRHANRLIRLLEEFGPGYFELAQLTRITGEQFRAIAPAVRGQQIHAHGEAIALIPENSEEIAAAVADLRREAAAEAPTRNERLSTLERRSNQMIAEFRQILAGKPEGTEKFLLRSTVRDVIAMLKAMDMEMGL